MKKGWIYLCIIFSFLISSCELIKTHTNSENDLLDCQSIEVIPTPVVNNDHSYYVVLIEGSPEYSDHKNKGADILKKVFNEVLEPGDKVAAIWMEVSSLGNDDALFMREEIQKNPLPELAQEPLPQFYPSPTPLQNNAPVAALIQHENEVKRVEKENSIYLHNFNCLYVFPIREQNHQTIEKWKTDQENQKQLVIETFYERIDSTNPDVMSVFEALKLASDIFSDVCSEDKYNNCQLIVVSSMLDWRSGNDTKKNKEAINNMGIDFTNVNVSVIWLDCQFFSDQFKEKCSTRLNVWTEHFSWFNASETNENIVFLNQDNVVEKLIAHIHQGEIK